MKRILMIAFAVTVCASATLAQAPAPGPAHERLRSLAGTWTVEAEEEGLKYTLRDTCEWFAGAFHIVCRSEGVGPAAALRGQTIIGYDAGQKIYTRYSHNSFGNASLMTGTVTGSVWTWSGDISTSNGKLKLRATGTEESPTSQSYKVEGSTDGAAWFVVEQGRSTRLP